MPDNHASTIGRPAALLTAGLAITYSVIALLSLFGVVPHPSSLFWQFLPSLLLSLSFLITIVCLHYSVPAGRRIYTALAIAFAIVYCTCVSVVYFTQLVAVIPAQWQGRLNDNHVLAFSNKSFMVAVDCLGYAVLSISAFFAALAFSRDREHKWLYRSFLYTALLMPFIKG